MPLLVQTPIMVVLFLSWLHILYAGDPKHHYPFCHIYIVLVKVSGTQILFVKVETLI